jgi:anti-sigma regulatory factor (Ser/Thr protein kinase)
MGARDSDLDRLTRRVRGRDAVTLASDAARTFGSAQWLGEDELARLCIVIEELVANLYDHGGLGEDDEVELTLSSEPDGIGVTLVDPGAPFDPWEAPRPVETPERGGGAGIGIVRAWAELVDYRVTEQGNRLELLLPLHW